jgi:non-ribosomal peptide synthetase component E (peptide arylation enzyme)
VTGSWTAPEDAPLDDLWALVEWRAARTPEALFATGAAGDSVSFEVYRAAVLRAAAALSERGVGPGSVVAWQLPTDLDAVVLIAALARLGATQVPMLASYRHRELRAVVEGTNPDLLVVPATWRGFDHEEMAEQVAPSIPRLIVRGGLPESDPADLPDAGGRTGAGGWVFFTSGTTAEPKGVRHTDATVIAAAVGTSEASLQTADDVYLVVTPIAHVGGAVAVCSGLLTGCRSVLVPAYRPGELAAVVARESVTLAAGPLTVQLGFLEANRRDPEARLFRSVRAYPIGGAPRPPDLHHTIRRELGGVGLLSGYGMTECPIATKGRVGDPDDRLATTEGRPTRGVEVRVVGADGTEAEPGAEGEIRVRGPQLFRGYVDASLDAAATDEDGYFRTGDLGRLDAGGFLAVTGRLKDVIIRKGENISAAEVEHLLRAHPAVADVAVIGVPDPQVGERCCAVIEIADGAAAPTLGEVAAFLEDAGLMRQKLPELLEVVYGLPRNAFGKADKQALRDRYAGTKW